jgi:Acetoacetate decarboxylase (ADC)
MPVVFGPSPGPRQGIDGLPYDYSTASRRVTAITFLSQVEALNRIMPPYCSLAGEPLVTVEWSLLRELEWLAGRSYSTLGVKFPVQYSGPGERATGAFLAVLWENLAEPIITGREELGFAKLFCELKEPRILRGEHHYSASWDGHTFMHMTISELHETDSPVGSSSAGDGVLHHRYLPHVDQSSGRAAVDEMVLTPSGGIAVSFDSFHTGRGSLKFIESTWQQLPTMHHIVNTLAALPILEYRAATVANTRGAKDLSDQRILR